MLTVLKYFMPRTLEKHYGIMVDWCLAQAKYYLDTDDMAKTAYWSMRANKYLLKRIDVLKRMGIEL